MLLCTEKRLHFIDGQEIRLKRTIDGVEYYFYLDRYSYEQSIVLRERYSFVDSLREVLGVGVENTVYANMKFFRDNVPEELVIFAPFIGIMRLTEEVTDIVQLCGYLHQLSRAIDFAAYAGAHQDIRARLNMTLDFLNEYEESYRSIILKSTLDSEEFEYVSKKAIKEILGEAFIDKGFLGASVGNAGDVRVQEVPRVGSGFEEAQEESKTVESSPTDVGNTINVSDPFAAFAALVDEFAEDDKKYEEEHKEDGVVADSQQMDAVELSNDEPEEKTEEELALDEIMRKMGGY